ncbi:hypothetical protein H0X48_04765 [Candidatus Dependentiae bacterium]|nr:hypothetical protein [Candidatus Dependentiae bacterium]
MKKLLITTALIASIAQCSLRADSLLYAIDAHNVEKVAKLLEKHGHLHHEYKKTLMRAAKQSSHAAKNKVGFFSSGTDFIKLITGMGFSGIGTLGLAAAGGMLWANKGDSPNGVLLGAGSGIATITGLSLMYKGWTLSTAKTRLERAREIETMISLKPAHHE